MRILTNRNSFVIIFVLLFPNSFLADQDRLLEEIDSTLTNITLTTVVATISFLLLLLFRNKYLGYLNLISGIALIVSVTGKVSHYLLTDVVAEGYIFAGFLQIAFSAIFGWIYRKHQAFLKDGIYSSAENIEATANKRVMTLNVVFMTIILSSVYNYILSHSQVEIEFSTVQFHLTQIVSLLFISLATYLFITNTQTGWVLGTAFLISIALPALISEIITPIINSKYHGDLPVTYLIINTIQIICFVACLLFILSRSVRDKFKIKRKQIFIAIAAGLILYFINTYITIQAAETSLKQNIMKR